MDQLFLIIPKESSIAIQSLNSNQSLVSIQSSKAIGDFSQGYNSILRDITPSRGEEIVIEIRYPNGTTKTVRIPI